MSEEIYYAAFRDDRLLENTITHSEIETDERAYQQAYDDAVDDLIDQHEFSANTDDAQIDSYIELKWYYDVQKLTKAEVLEAVEDAKANYNTAFDDFDINDIK